MSNDTEDLTKLVTKALMDVWPPEAPDWLIDRATESVVESLGEAGVA